MISKKIYSEVYAFCEGKGLFERLKQSLRETASEKQYAQKNIEKSGLDVLDAVHCVLDKERSIVFLEEIDKNIEGGETVLEAGLGTGILSFMAAAKGANVYGVEFNPEVLELANEIKAHFIKKGIVKKEKVNFFLGDAMKYEPPEKVDVIISENIYTGMFHEKQVQIMNHLIKFLKEDGKVIPSGLRSFLFLNQAEFPHKPKNKEEFWMSGKTPLSSEVEYSNLDFTERVDPLLDKNFTILVNAEGELNSLLIYSTVQMPSGQEIKRHQTIFLNDDVTIALQPPISVEKGEGIKLHLSYTYGSKPEDATIEVKKS